MTPTQHVRRLLAEYLGTARASLLHSHQSTGLSACCWRYGLLACGVVNNSLAAAVPTSALLRLRAAEELPQIDKVKNEHTTRLAVVPMLPTEPVGIPALEALSRVRVALTR